MSKVKASVILSTYNEAGNIIDLVEELRYHLRMRNIKHEVIISDNHSEDKTGILAQKYFSKTPDVRVILQKKNLGLARSLRSGLETAVGDIIVVMDSDFNHEPRRVPKLIEATEKNDIAVGSRFIKGGGMANRKREFLSKIFNLYLIKPILTSPINDNLCGFFAIKREKLNKFNFDEIFYGYGDYFIRLIYLASKKGFTFREIPVFYVDRTYGESKSNFTSMLIDYFLAALKLRFNKLNNNGRKN